jgi:hypothetical protein
MNFTQGPDIEVRGDVWRCEMRSDGIRIAGRLDPTRLNYTFRVEWDGQELAIIPYYPTTLRTVPREVLIWLMEFS